MSDVREDEAVLPNAADRPEVMRWAAMFALALAALGVALRVGGDDLWAAPIVVLAMVISAFTALQDTRRAPAQVNARGKRWRPWRARAEVQGVMAVGVLAMTGSVALMISSRFGGWAPASGDDWQILVFAFMTILWSVPLAYPKFAGWALDGIK